MTATIIIGTILVAIATGVNQSSLPFLGLIVPKVAATTCAATCPGCVCWGIAMNHCDLIAIIMPFELPVSVILGVVGAAVFVGRRDSGSEDEAHHSQEEPKISREALADVDETSAPADGAGRRSISATFWIVGDDPSQVALLVDPDRCFIIASAAIALGLLAWDNPMPITD